MSRSADRQEEARPSFWSICALRSFKEFDAEKTDDELLATLLSKTHGDLRKTAQSAKFSNKERPCLQLGESNSDPNVPMAIRVGF